MDFGLKWTSKLHLRKRLSFWNFSSSNREPGHPIPGSMAVVFSNIYPKGSYVIGWILRLTKFFGALYLELCYSFSEVAQFDGGTQRRLESKFSGEFLITEAFFARSLDIKCTKSIVTYGEEVFLLWLNTISNQFNSSGNNFYWHQSAEK
jgi:hypothetical protein